MTNSIEAVADAAVALSRTRSLEEAFRIYPRAEEFFRRYSRFIMQGSEDAQLRLRFDDEIRMLREVDDCMGGRLVTGFVSTTIYFQPASAAPVELMVKDIKIHDSNLSGDDSAVLMACLHSKVLGRRMPIKAERYKNGFQSAIEIRWPLDQSDIFQFLATGDWPGFETRW